MIIWKNYRIKLYPNEEQFKTLMSICDTFRYCYNWGLAFCNRYRVLNQMSMPSLYVISDAFTAYRNTHPWLQDFDINTCRYALMNVLDAFNAFYEHRCKYPKFKDKKHFIDVRRKFKVRGDRLTFWGEYKEYVHIPGFGRFKKDRIYCGKNHNIPIGSNVKYDNVYIKYDGLAFWLSLSVQTEVDDPINTSTEIIGIDVGIRTSAYLSNGLSFTIDNPRLRLYDKRRRKYDDLHRRDRHRREFIAERTKTKYENIPKSKNAIKRAIKRLENNRKITNIYKYNYHVFSKQIANMDAGIVVIEDLPVGELNRGYRFTRHANIEARMGFLLRYIQYKCEEAGKRVIKAPNDFPSTQLCSRCGNSYRIGETKTYRCPHCGLVIDRDLNAAINLRKFGESVLNEA